MNGTLNVRLCSQDKRIEYVTQTIEQISDGHIVSMDVPPGMSAGSSYMIEVSAADGSWMNETSVSVEPSDFFLMIELDKLVYKPGQEIKTRVLSVDPFLKASASKSVVVEIQNPKSFIIQRWETTLDGKGYGNFEYKLSEKAPLGSYTLTASALEGAVQTSQTLEVDEYILPKYEVVVSTDQATLSSVSAGLSGTVQATYTYGEGVAGSVEVEVVQKFSSPWSPWIRRGAPAFGGFAAEVVSVSPPSSGEKVLASMRADLQAGAADFNFPKQELGVSTFSGSLSVRARVIESATKEEQSGSSGEVGLMAQEYKVELSGAPSFQPGLDFQVDVALLVSSPEQTLPSSVTLQLYLGTRAGAWTPEEGSSSWVDLAPVVLIDSESGLGSYTLSVPQDNSSCCPASVEEDQLEDSYSRDCCFNSLSVSLNYFGDEKHDWSQVSTNSRNPQRSISPSNHFIQIRQVENDSLESVRFRYSVTLGGAVVQWAVLGQLGVVAAGTLREGALDPGYLSIPLDRLSFAPLAHLLMWYTTESGEMVVARAGLSATGSLMDHPVTAVFSETEAMPGADLEVQVAAASSARVYLLAVDKSVLLQSGGRSSALTAEMLFGGKSLFHSHAGSGAECYVSVGSRAVAAAGAMVLGPLLLSSCENNQGGGEVVLEDFEMVDLAMPGLDGANEREADAPDATPLQARQFFPEFWLWRSVDVDASGAASLVVTAPDTITSWALSAFAISDLVGYGVAEEASEIRVLKDFFISALLPYSLVRGETVVVNVGVFNYRAEHSEANITLLPPDSQLLQVVGPLSVLVEGGVPAGGSASVSFTIQAVGLGVPSLEFQARSQQASNPEDAVIKTMKVIAEGAVRVVVSNLVVQLGQNSQEEDGVLEVLLPSTRVPGSSRSSLTVIGDIMGPSVDNLDRLLTMPTGCGEQNMITLAPNVYVLHYLQAIQNLHPEVRSRAEGNMREGYVRELNYQHPDSSFSAFGEQDPSGSTWLTAFVLKVFSQSSSFIFIDPNVLADVGNWLESLQQGDGSFLSQGTVIHKEMQGGAASGSSLTAYVLIALLHAGSLQRSGVQDALDYLQGQDVEDNYAQVISTYAEALACKKQEEGLLQGLDCSNLDSSLDKMMGLTVSEDGQLIHFEPSGSGSTGSPVVFASQQFLPHTAPASFIEISSYALLALVAGGRAGQAFPLARWLLTQRNAFGGFSSTQDTVVGLEALSEYGAAVYSQGALDEIVVELTVAGNTQIMTVNGSNFDVLQRVELPAGTDRVELHTQGQGTALLQLTAEYNVEVEAEASPFSLGVKWSEVEGVVGVAMVAEASLTLNLGVVQEGQTSGMVLLQVGCPSGLVPTGASLQKLLGQQMVKRADISSGGGGADIYLEELIPGQQVVVTFHAEEVSVVKDRAPAQSSVMLYYEPETLTSFAAVQEDDVLKELPDPEVNVDSAQPPPDVRVSSSIAGSRNLGRSFLFDAILMFFSICVMRPIIV
eukprot:CAMPEP_0196598400 /NCGR_PEP_ID=MMETSP1081-20130531/94299_1 /TAXON_ID=36882 /ORGANISM="Pyramimonas amylifera, Strain CCMP720" /LENGTH=1477 /DNA_ID=CAMNT_0041924091 /DNA_START=147 /DNA_END=4580 /DNA_ORIENTATION=+